ncbi:Transmembrane protein 165 [Geodia barretti]|nr:Transmembrane protein 165 [Geodia barretti]
MTFLSVVLGFATMVIPRAVTFYVSTGLLALFGVKMLYEGWNMSSDEGREEFDEVSEELRKREEVETVGDQEQGLSTRLPLRRRLRCLGPVTSAIFLQAFTLTFLAEWGDRSQITTIILAARENPVGITIGGTLGHALCTALAVIGGKMVAQRISVKTVTIIGGVVFLLFAATALLHPELGPQGSDLAS